MTKIAMKSLGFGGVLLVSAIALTGCRGGSGENHATVNGIPITKDEYIAYLERKVNVLVQTPQGPAQGKLAQPLDFQATNDLVNQKLLLEMARKDRVEPTAADIDKEIQHQSTRDPAFVKKLQNEGMSLQQIREQLKVDIAKYRIVTKGVTIKDPQIDEFIRKNPAQFMNPKIAQLQWMRVKDAKRKADADSDLSAGQSFETVAKRYTVESSVDYPSVVFASFPPALQKIVDSTEVGKTTGWLADQGTWVRFNVVEKKAESKLALKPWMRAEVMRRLAEQKGSVAVDLNRRMIEARRKAKIVIPRKELQQRFEVLEKQVKEEQKTGTKR
jgi:hypothetical protein